MYIKTKPQNLKCISINFRNNYPDGFISTYIYGDDMYIYLSETINIPCDFYEITEEEFNANVPQTTVSTKRGG